MSVPDSPTTDHRALADLAVLPALPFSDVARVLDLPLSTLDKLRAKGSGPKTFLIGRRLFVRQSDLREWLDDLAKKGNQS